jgi:hypothetical protein
MPNPPSPSSRRYRIAAVACGTLALFAAVVILPDLLPRPFLGLGDARRAPLHFWLDGGRAGVSWYRAGGARQPWAGQVKRFGVRYNVYTYDGSDLSVPTWYLAAAASLGSAAAAAFARRADPRARLRAQGRCVRCGYDLRATPNRCPECGMIPTKA